MSNPNGEFDRAFIEFNNLKPVYGNTGVSLRQQLKSAHSDNPGTLNAICTDGAAYILDGVSPSTRLMMIDKWPGGSVHFSAARINEGSSEITQAGMGSDGPRIFTKGITPTASETIQGNTFTLLVNDDLDYSYYLPGETDNFTTLSLAVRMDEPKSFIRTFLALHNKSNIWGSVLDAAKKHDDSFSVK